MASTFKTIWSWRGDLGVVIAVLATPQNIVAASSFFAARLQELTLVRLFRSSRDSAAAHVRIQPPPTQQFDTFKSTSYFHSFTIRARLNHIKLLAIVLQVSHAFDTRLNFSTCSAPPSQMVVMATNGNGPQQAFTPVLTAMSTMRDGQREQKKAAHQFLESFQKSVC